MHNLTGDTFLLYAIQNYDNPFCSGIEEIQHELKRIRYIRRLCTRYHTSKTLRERLLLNHIIIFYNTFRAEAATRLLFFKLEPELWPTLKTFLLFLSYMPDVVYGINGKDIFSSSININVEAAMALRNLK